MRIRSIEKSDHSRVISLTEELSEWFTERARRVEIPLDLRVHRGFLAEESGEILGFLILDSYLGDARIGWIGVRPEYRRGGIGRRLVEMAEREFRATEAEYLKVETVARGDAKGSPYEETLKFYEAVGFDVEEVEKDGWDDGSDKAIYAKALNGG
ncbi:MAG: GNAT family N-acetyltransferase [Candidatus Hadarchaeota archaeon]